MGDSIRGSSDSVTNKEQAAAASSQTTQKQPPVTISVSKPMAPPPPPQPTQQAAAPSTPSFSSIVDKVFGGKMETTYTCSQCEHESRHKETFTDLNLAFPNTSPTSEKGEDDKEAQLSVQDLLSNYLSPEKLCGDNQYRCDGCDGLRVSLPSISHELNIVGFFRALF